MVNDTPERPAKETRAIKDPRPVIVSRSVIVSVRPLIVSVVNDTPERPAKETRVIKDPRPNSVRHGDCCASRVDMISTIRIA